MKKHWVLGLLILSLLATACGSSKPASTQVEQSGTTAISTATQEQQSPDQVIPTEKQTATLATQATSTTTLAVSTAIQVISTGAVAPTISANLDGKILLQERCTRCHSLSRVISKSESAEKWKMIVESMFRKGAELSEEEKQALIDYLSATYPN